jgi:hypothetical protein
MPCSVINQYQPNLKNKKMGISKEQNQYEEGSSSFLHGGANSQFTNQVSDGNSGASMDISCWTPDYNNTVSPIPDDYFFLGNYAVPGGDNPPAGYQMLYKAVNDDPNNPCFAPPASFGYIWSKSHCELQIYSIIAPFGYCSVGCIVTGDNNSPTANNVPFLDKLMCVRQDLCNQVSLNVNNVVWNDQGSGANANASVYLLPTSRTAWAVSNYNATQQTADIDPTAFKKLLIK